jgi:hypothetical protein
MNEKEEEVERKCVYRDIVNSQTFTSSDPHLGIDTSDGEDVVKIGLDFVTSFACICIPAPNDTSQIGRPDLFAIVPNGNRLNRFLMTNNTTRENREL